MPLSNNRILTFSTITLAAVAVVAALLVWKPWREHATLEATIESMGFVPLSPPSTLAKPGVLVVAESRDPLRLALVCTSEGALGYKNEWEYLDSDTVTIQKTERLSGTFRLELDASELLGGSQDASMVRSVSVSLTDTNILSIADQDVFERLPLRANACEQAIANRVSRGDELTMIRSVLVATGEFRISFENAAATELRAKLTERLAGELNGQVDSTAEHVIVGEQLFWGVRDDPGLAEISIDGATGSVDIPSILDPSQRVRTIDLPEFISRDVTPVRQPSFRSCWAAAGAMLWNDTNGTELDAGRFATTIGDEWARLFEDDQGLPLGAHTAFADAAGFVALPPMNLTIDRYAELLREHGPLWIATLGPPTFSAHARVLVGVYGDGTPHGTRFEFIDPRDGVLRREPFLKFITSFEREARAALERDRQSELRWQIFYPR